ncbi:Probable UDP-N-acetyl-D-mannosaminuronic acid transferase [hydrothermal vent metagenome]|uniref:Probable UDP-N-acetyl-D-mannosaminuronic acid transferase n=1 Tax=hydrothermal vent metagenome TaxID=652676 RepID=A0A1W1BDA9_9ZZZZ
MDSRLINGYKINAFSSKDDFLNRIISEKKILVAMNAEKILQDNDKLRDVVNDNIGYSDGVGAVIALKQDGLEAIKIPGSEFWLDIIDRFSNTKTFYLVGSSTAVINSTVKRLKEEYSHINIVGYRNGFLKNGDRERLVEDLQNKKPDIVFVAQGSPKQEFLMSELIKEYQALYMGLGGSFDIYSGKKKRAPNLFLNYQLEWFYRLIKEPTRVKRQLVLVKFFILYVIFA